MRPAEIPPVDYVEAIPSPAQIRDELAKQIPSIAAIAAVDSTH